MNKAYLVAMLSYIGLPCIGKYCLDFVIDHVAPKFQQFVAPVLGFVIGAAYGAITSNYDPQATINAASQGANIGLLTLAAHAVLPDVIKVTPPKV